MLRPSGLLPEIKHLPGIFFNLSRASGPNICLTLQVPPQSQECALESLGARVFECPAQATSDALQPRPEVPLGWQRVTSER